MKREDPVSFVDLHLTIELMNIDFLNEKEVEVRRFKGWVSFRCLRRKVLKRGILERGRSGQVDRATEKERVSMRMGLAREKEFDRK